MLKTYCTMEFNMIQFVPINRENNKNNRNINKNTTKEEVDT